MGKVHRVPANWEHPEDEDGDFIPLDEFFPYNEEEVQEGLCDGWLEDDPPNYGCDVMPNWPDAERTHYQMYETSSGTPISPVMESPEALARWFAADTDYSSCLADIHDSLERSRRRRRDAPYVLSVADSLLLNEIYADEHLYATLGQLYDADLT